MTGTSEGDERLAAGDAVTQFHVDRHDTTLKRRAQTRRAIIIVRRPGSSVRLPTESDVAADHLTPPCVT